MINYKDIYDAIIDLLTVKRSGASIPEITVNKDCIELIKEFEGFSSAPYLDASGTATIGYGNTFYEDGTKVTMGDEPITEERAEELLIYVVNAFSRQIKNLIKVKLNDNQFSAIVSLVYNIGITNFRKSTMLRLLNEGNIDDAILEFPVWRRSGGKILRGLQIRRAKEMLLFLTR